MKITAYTTTFARLESKVHPLGIFEYLNAQIMKKHWGHNDDLLATIVFSIFSTKMSDMESDEYSDFDEEIDDDFISTGWNLDEDMGWVDSDEDFSDVSFELENYMLDHEAKSVDLSSSHLSIFGVPTEYQSALESLNLDDNRIMLSLCNFHECPNLETISLRGNQLRGFSKVLQCKSLKSLMLSQNQIADDEIYNLKYLNNIDTLHISYNYINHSIFHLMFVGRDLVDFSVMENPFMSDPEPFMKALPTMRKLRKLIIGNNSFVHPDWDDLVANYIKSNPPVCYLVVYGVCKLNPILNAIKHNTILETLCIMGAASFLDEKPPMFDPAQIYSDNQFLRSFRVNDLDPFLFEASSRTSLEPLHKQQIKNAIRIMRLLQRLSVLEPVKAVIVGESLGAFPESDQRAIFKYLMANAYIATEETFDHRLFKRQCILECGPQPICEYPPPA